MCVQLCYRFWMERIALRGVACFTGIHFALRSFMTYTLKVPDWTNMRKSCQELDYEFWMANIALRGVTYFTGIHFSLGSLHALIA